MTFCDWEKKINVNSENARKIVFRNDQFHKFYTWPNFYGVVEIYKITE